MLRTVIRAFFTRAPATTAAAFLFAMLRTRVLVSSSAAFLKASSGIIAFDPEALGGVEDFLLAKAAAVVAVAVVVGFAACTDVAAGGVDFLSTRLASPADDVTAAEPQRAPVFDPFTEGDETVALCAARSELRTRRSVMPCMPLRTNVVGVALAFKPSTERAAARDELRAMTARRATAAVAAIGTERYAVFATGCCGGRILRTRMRLRFLNRILLLGGGRGRLVVGTLRPRTPPVHGAKCFVQREAG